jgi:hypothetical protein
VEKLAGVAATVSFSEFDADHVDDGVQGTGGSFDGVGVAA